MLRIQTNLVTPNKSKLYFNYIKKKFDNPHNYSARKKIIFTIIGLIRIAYCDEVTVSAIDVYALRVQLLTYFLAITQTRSKPEDEVLKRKPFKTILHL